jgi:nucleotide-binding universal stress UspA family protein
VFHVIEPFDSGLSAEVRPPYPMKFEGFEKKRLKWGRSLVARGAATVREAGFTADAIVARGNVRKRVVDEARKWRADLIVVGSRGRTRIGRLLLGSVSEYVARHAPCSVQIVRGRQKL